jgi:acyl-CoA synthetase (NDP forming)/GNAT superfamily N-acetyltransferase
LTIARSTKGRFSVERLYAPKSVAVIGPETPEGARVLTNMAAACFHGTTYVVGDAPGGFASVADLLEAPDLAILACAPAAATAYVHALAARGSRAAIAVGDVPDLAALARDSGVRVLGPHSFGIAVPRLGLNASLGHIPVPQGRVALLTQSASLARAVLDWAGPNGVGFSHIVGVGGNTNMGFGLALDWLSRDPDTGLILVDIRRVRNRRAFISAARAASRLRPVVAIRPGGLLIDPSGEADAVFAAALNRAGVFVARHMDEFLAAAETLSRSKPARSESLAIVTNAIGPGRLAADAALAAGIKLSALAPEAQSALAASLPADLIFGLVYARDDATTEVAELAAMVSALPDVGGVLVLLAPNGDGDGAAVEAVIAAASVSKLPVLACVMGETTGAAHRQRLAAAGLPAFATPEQAVQAFCHLVRDRRARIAARELPGRRVLDVAPDHEAVARQFAAARAERRDQLTQPESAVVLAGYGVAQASPPVGCITASLRLHDDPTFGPALGLTIGPAAPAYELPPLNLPLAQAFATRAGLPEAEAATAARLLVRVSQLVVDEPQIASLAIAPMFISGTAATFASAAIALRPPGHSAELAISAYPEHLSETFAAGGETFTIRPIRPEDAEAHRALIARLPPEDLRYRFFTALRELSPEQIVRLTQIDYDREMAFLAVRQSDQASVGVARLVREMGEARGEFAIVVQPDVKGRGLARHLMERLIAWGRQQGLAEIAGTVLADNSPMLGFVRRLGFVIHRIPDEGDVVEAVLTLQP